MSTTVWDHLRLITPGPQDETGLLITVAEAMTHCRVTPNLALDETSWFEDAIWSAQGLIEGPRGGGIPLLTQQWELSLDRWPPDFIEVPLTPVQSIDSIVWLDLAYNPNTLPAGAAPNGAGGQYVYDLDADPVHIRRAFGVVWPILGLIPGAVKVTFTCGFCDTGPEWPKEHSRLKQAIKLLVSHWYRNRDAVVGVDGRDSSTILPLGVDAIFDQYRAGRFG